MGDRRVEGGDVTVPDNDRPTAVLPLIPELLAGNARRYGARTAFDDGRRSVSWAEPHGRTARLAAGLPVERGQRVAFLLDDSVELMEGLLATARAAAVGVLLSPRSTDAELAHLLADCDPAVLVTDRRDDARRPPGSRRYFRITSPIRAGSDGCPLDAVSPPSTGMCTPLR
jgi:non-ribosomal peptide synthetase component F